MHYIQRKILGRLLYAESLNYASMRPDDVESNHFAYHLDQLVKSGLIAKEEKLYSLSIAGLGAVDRLSHARMADRLQPHIVTAIDLVAANGQTLLYKRNFQPYIYRVGFPLGKMHHEESVLQAAERELLEKTGLNGIPLAHRGMVYIDSRQGGQTISKILCHVFHGEVEAPLATVPASEPASACGLTLLIWMPERLCRPFCKSNSCWLKRKICSLPSSPLISTSTIGVWMCV